LNARLRWLKWDCISNLIFTQKSHGKINMQKHWLFLLFCLNILATAWGCSQPSVIEKPIDPTQQQLILIGAAYQQYTYAKESPPSKPEDLKQNIQELGGNDAVWISTRDGQPFVIVWNLDLRQPPTWASPNSTPVLAYEKTGKNGKRFVRTVMGSVEELSEQEFAAASFPPGHSPEKSL
jgi:hypothetical protein